jgi:energy-coupling factor transport system permease protein
MRPQHRITHPRALHPGAWWLWALGLAAAASRTLNPVPLVLIIAVTWFVVSARRGDTPWAASYALFFRLSLAVIAIHLVFQVLFSGHAQGLTVLFTLPEVELPEAAGVKLGGEVTLEAVLSAFYVALQLAAIFCCIGAANALGSARQLLRYVPAALYEIGIACVIALTFAPQLVTDARRVREAARLRGGNVGRMRRFGRLVMPILEGALERSVDLAAAMDSRGYGRTTVADPRARRLTSSLVVAGMLGVCLGLYGVLGGTEDSWLGLPTLVVGLALVAAAMVLGGRRTGRTRYRPDPWALPEFLVVACGAAAAVLTFWQVRVDPTLMVLSSPTQIPPVPPIACLGILIGLLPAVLAPPLPRRAPVLPVVDRRREEAAA